MPSPIPKLWLPWMWLQGDPGPRGPDGPRGDPGITGGTPPPPPPGQIVTHPIVILPFPSPPVVVVQSINPGLVTLPIAPPPPAPPAPQPLTYRGIYKSNFWYIMNDVVDYDNKLWVCRDNNNNIVPTTPSLYWQALGGQWIIQDGELKNKLIRKG